VQRLVQGVDLAPHPDPLHEAPRRLVVGEAVGRDPPQVQLVEAEPQQLAHGLGGVPVPGLVGVDHPAELGLDPTGLLLDLGLGPGVTDLDHQVADDRAVELDDQEHREPLGVLERGAVLVDRRGGGGEPPTDLGETAVLPGRLEVVGGRAPQRQASRAHRPRHGIQWAAHPLMVSACGDVRPSARRHGAPGCGGHPASWPLTTRSAAGTLP